MLSTDTARVVSAMRAAIKMLLVADVKGIEGTGLVTSGEKVAKKLIDYKLGRPTRFYSP